MARTDLPTDEFDGPWKEALERFLPDALRLLAPEIHRAIDWSREVVFLNEELQRLLPEGGAGKGCVDVMEQVFLNSGEASRLLQHAEVQGEPRQGFEQRVFRCWSRLFDATDLPVESIVILAGTRRNWRPDHFETYAVHSPVRLDFLSAKLMDFEDRLEELEQSNNPFSLLVVAHLTARRTKDGEERLYPKLRLVLRIIDRVIRLPEELKIRFRDGVCRMEEEKKVGFINCFEELHMEKATRASILRVLEARFGPVPASITETVAAVHDLKRLEDLTRTAATVPDLDAFARALDC